MYAVIFGEKEGISQAELEKRKKAIWAKKCGRLQNFTSKTYFLARKKSSFLLPFLKHLLLGGHNFGECRASKKKV